MRCGSVRRTRLANSGRSSPSRRGPWRTVVVCDAASVDALLEFGSHHALKVGAYPVAEVLSVGIEMKMHGPETNLSSLTLEDGAVGNATLRSESRHIRM